MSSQATIVVRAADRGNHRMPTALIVEDEPDANHLLAMLVQLRGYKTTSAFTGREALLQVSRSRPDLVFLDLMLPDLSGYEVCRTLKSEVRSTTIPVVMVTARLASENRIEGFRAGAIDYVPKPYTPDQIFSAMVQADAWRDQVKLDLDSMSIRFDGPDDVGSLRDMTRLRSNILTRNASNDARSRKLDRFLENLTTLLSASGQKSLDGPVAVLDYQREADRITLTLRHLDHPIEALADLIEAGPFDTSEFPIVAGKTELVLSCSIEARSAARISDF